MPEDIRLHTNYRSWCGNGYFAVVAETYIDTAIKGFESDDAAVRLRSLKAGRRISGWDNDPRFVSLVDKALHDSDFTVRELAWQYHFEMQR